ncbi:activating transcription factor 7-interacting protein 1 isoform X3 [Conger conger]|uniref:activating transcription factor 7-interacting protein 1 isoform X3 n=1 Tax=Conger conger TaxID=82655 RepID=UPI002A5A9EA7|nr:activating transcription factor 7-interacting protein 1 isoform X3 [Conger conger]
MQTCCVVGCQNRPDPKTNLHFYRIPIGSHPFQKLRRQLWLQAIKHVDWTEDLIKNARICSTHFKSGKASVDSASPDFVPSVFAYTDQTQKSHTRLLSLQKKRNLDENTLPVEKRRDVRVLDDRPAFTQALESTPAPALVMKKRKIYDSNEISPRKPSNAPDAGLHLPHPVKTFSKPEIQQLIKQEILATVQRSEHKMDELIKRIQRTDTVSKYEAVLIRLQADVKKIKRREQVALACMRKLKVPAPATPAEQSQPLSSRDCPICIVDPPSASEPPPAPPRVMASPTSISSSRISADGDQSGELSTLEPSEMDGEVVFCGVMLPRKRIVEGFWQRRLKRNRVVDLTEDAGMDADMGPDLGGNGDPNMSQNGDAQSQNQDPMESMEQETAPATGPERATDTAHVQTLGPTDSAQTPAPSWVALSSQDSPVSAAPADADNQTTSHAEVTSCPQSDKIQPATADPPCSTLSPAEDEWRSRLPPLPATVQPSQVPPEAAGSSLPQQVTLTVARIKNPKGIGALWNMQHPDPQAAPVSRYHIYAMQEMPAGCFSTWRNVGTVRAMALPMACKLTDHGPGRRFCFAVVSEDVYGRFGPYSHVQAIGPQD